MIYFKEKNGITIVALITTIVLLLILASITYRAVNGNLFGNAKKTKIQTEIVDLQGILFKKQKTSGAPITNGRINDLLGIDSPYNDKLVIEDGKLVYLASNWEQDEIEMLEEIGIEARTVDKIEKECAQNSRTFYIVDETNKNKYTLENIGTMWDYAEKKAAGTFQNSNNESYNKMVLLEDIDLKCSEEKNWTPKEFSGEFDGQYHTINGVYIKNTSRGNIGLFSVYSGTIKNVILGEGYIEGNQNVGGLVGVVESNIKFYNCINRANIFCSDSGNVGGLVGYIKYITKEQIISGCANYGSVTAYGYCGGIIGRGTLQTGGKYTISNCYNVGTITCTYTPAPTRAGAMYGGIDANLDQRNCYNVGTITRGHAIGGTDCYSKASTTSGNNRTEADMKTQEFVNLLNTVHTTTIDPETEEETTTTTMQEAWVMDTSNINNGFPILSWQAQH